MINLLNETIAILDKHNKCLKDIKYIVTKNCTIKNKKKFFQSMDFKYDCGFGLEMIPTDLKLVGKDFWIERKTYDGSEWWEFKQKPEKLKAVENIILSRKGYTQA